MTGSKVVPSRITSSIIARGRLHAGTVSLTGFVAPPALARWICS